MVECTAMVNAKVLTFPVRSRSSRVSGESSRVGDVVQPSDVQGDGSGWEGELLSPHPRVNLREWMGVETVQLGVESERPSCPVCPGCGVETSWVQELVEEGGRLRYEDTSEAWKCLECHEGSVSDEG